MLLRSNRNFRFELIRFMRGLNARTFSSPVVFDPNIRHTFLREVCRDLNAFSTNRDSSKRNTTRAKDLSLSRNKRNWSVIGINDPHLRPTRDPRSISKRWNFFYSFFPTNFDIFSNETIFLILTTNRIKYNFSRILANHLSLSLSCADTFFDLASTVPESNENGSNGSVMLTFFDDVLWLDNGTMKKATHFFFFSLSRQWSSSQCGVSSH